MLLTCAQDRILPVPQVCGDGAVVGTEGCDNESEGCAQCQIVEGWVCPDNECAEICGDERIVGEEDCDPPDGLACDDSCRSSVKDEACDMTGYWVVRQTDFSRDVLVGSLQIASGWYVYRFEQDGERFVTQQSIYCSVQASGTATVRPRPAGDRALLYTNIQDGREGRPPREGTFARRGDRCEFYFERVYILRGLQESYLPSDFRAHPHLDEIVPPMPAPANQDVLAEADVPGALDLDGDGRPGLAWQITGVLSGVRHSAQREWTEYTTDSDALPIPAHAIEFTTRSLFDHDETVLYVEDCGTTCDFLKTGSVPSQDEPSRVTFRYLGRELDDPRVSAVVGGPLYEDEDVDMATCERARQALLHDDALQP